MNGSAVVSGLGMSERITLLPTPVSLPTPKPIPAMMMTTAAITVSLKGLLRQASGTTRSSSSSSESSPACRVASPSERGLSAFATS